MRPDLPVPLAGGGHIVGYLDSLKGTAEMVLAIEQGAPVAMRSGAVTYINGWCDSATLDRLVSLLADRAGIETRDLPNGVPVRETGAERFWFNHGPDPIETHSGRLEPAEIAREPLLR